MGVEEKVEGLHAAIESLEKPVRATQDQLSSLPRRFVELDPKQ